MGNLLSCDKCPATTTNSVITFSEEFVLKVADGILPEKEDVSGSTLDTIAMQADRDIFKQLKCIDDSHSHALGLTPEIFETLAKRLDAVLFDPNHHLTTETKKEEIIRCYKRHRNCTLRCTEHVNTLSDYMDLILLQKMKKQIDAVQKKRAEDEKNKYKK